MTICVAELAMGILEIEEISDIVSVDKWVFDKALSRYYGDIAPKPVQFWIQVTFVVNYELNASKKLLKTLK